MIGDQSWAASETGVPTVGRPCLADQATYGDDGVGEVEEGVDDGGPALVAAGEAVEGVLRGTGALHVPPPTFLDRRLLAFVRDAAVQAAFIEQNAGLVGVVAGVQVDGGVVGWRSEVLQAVQGRGEQRGVVAVDPGQDTAQWNLARLCAVRAVGPGPCGLCVRPALGSAAAPVAGRLAVPGPPGPVRRPGRRCAGPYAGPG